MLDYKEESGGKGQSRETETQWQSRKGNPVTSEIGGISVSVSVYISNLIFISVCKLRASSSDVKIIA